jgi:hypothetical protein
MALRVLRVYYNCREYVILVSSFDYICINIIRLTQSSTDILKRPQRTHIYTRHNIQKWLTTNILFQQILDIWISPSHSNLRISFSVTISSNNLKINQSYKGRDGVVGTVTRQRAWRFGIRTPGGSKSFRTFQTGPGSHPVSYTMGTGSFPGVKRPGPGVD